MNNEITRRKFIQSHGIVALIIAYICGVELQAEETNNYGFHFDRTRLDDRTGRLEKALADEWARENETRYNYGILQLLMLQAAPKEGPEFDPWLTERERKIVAMVVQWLGTNCGRSFLYEASRRAGKEFECYPFYNSTKA